MNTQILRWMGSTSLYTFVQVDLDAPCYSQPLHVEDLPQLTATNPILVSDDDLNLLTLIQTVLEHEIPLKTIGTLDSRETLRLSTEIPVSLIISDVMKPGIDGFEILRRVRANPETCDLPYMFVTARSDRASIERGQALGVDRYMVKPFFPHELISTVRQLLLERYRKVMICQ